VTSAPTPPARESDPYDVPPPWWERYPDWIWTVSVGLLTVVLTVVSFPPLKGPEFAYAFAVPAMFWAYRRPTFRRYAWTMLAAQAIAWTTLLGWLHHVTWFGLFLLGPAVGAWVGVWYLAAWWVIPRMVGRPTATRLLALTGLAGAWVVIEWTRNWLLSGFPWLPLAASQWQRPSVLQIAAYTGATGVSFVLIAVNIGFAAVAHSLFHDRQTGWRLRRPEFLFALFLLMVCVSVHVQETFNRSRFTQSVARVGVVQPYIPQAVKWDSSKGPAILETLQRSTMLTSVNSPDFILWPEASTPWAVRGDDRLQGWAESLAAQARAPLVVGTIAIENRGTPSESWTNSIVVVGPQFGLQTAYYSKRHLVPFGEYVPLRFLLGWLHKVVPVGEDDFRRGDSAAPLLVPVRKDSLAVGPLICFEDIFPDLARADVRDGAELLFVATNNAWYGEGGAAYQHAAHSVLRAVETRRPVVRCGNGGWSGWMDEFGSIRAVLTRDASGSVHTEPGLADSTIYFAGRATLNVTRDARWIGRRSFYVEHGDWFVAVAAALALLTWVMLRHDSTPQPLDVPPPVDAAV
jgi:apolipoprotein N-acyltransferase